MGIYKLCLGYENQQNFPAKQRYFYSLRLSYTVFTLCIYLPEKVTSGPAQ